MSDYLITPKQVMFRLKISRATLYKHVRAGNFPPPQKIGAFSYWRESDLSKFPKVQRQGITNVWR